MSEHKEETDEEFYSRYESYFNRSDIDGWEARKAMNDLAGQDAIAEPKVYLTTVNTILICIMHYACQCMTDCDIYI